jgi:hypothetical protein
MSDSSMVAALWFGTGMVWLAVWRASARAGIRLGAALKRNATVAAARRIAQPAPIAEVCIPRSGLAAMIAAAVVVPLIYATSSSVLDPIGIWFGVAAGAGIAGALASAWEGAGIGIRRQAALTVAGSARDASAM